MTEPEFEPEALKSAAALAFDFRSSIASTCLRCLGPIGVGDRIVPAKFGSWHRSCWFVREKDVRVFRRRRVLKPKPPLQADPRQLNLFSESGGK